MLEWMNTMILTLADPLLNGLLHLPTDLALVIVAVGTGSIITFSRLFTTDQDMLKRCDRDKKRLHELIREAKARKDRPAVRRHRATVNMIGMIAMKEEGWPLLAALIPIALLGTWCFQRLAFVPPRAGEPVSVMAYFPISAVGELAHIVPQEGVRAVSSDDAGTADRWIQEIVDDVDPKTHKPVGGVATWRVRADAKPKPYRIEIRHKASTVAKDVLVGHRVYSPDVQFYGADQTISCVQIGMKPVKLLGIVPGIQWLLLPPWLLAYFLIAIPSVSLIKRLARIH